MALFLAKTEPSEYSIDDLAADEITHWTGVRNPTAVRTIRSMLPGDRVLIYHSGTYPAIVGAAQVVTDPQPDPNDEKSWFVDLKYLQAFEQPVTLREIKETGLFDDWALVRQGRLSTMSVPAQFETWFWHRVRPGA
jgi:predicted RNA-binding protein with PUA-like domain